MRTGAIYRAGSSECLIPKCKKTATTLERMRGLLGRPPLLAGEGFLIAPCPSVHTIGMRYPLDLVFLDSSGSVLKCVESLRPWRMSACAGAYATLELPPGAVGAAGIQTGDQLEWREC